MKIWTSYFYMLRFFRPYHIPLSTAIWDPAWFHQGKGNEWTWKDKNGVWNGLRIEELNPSSCHASGCPCPYQRRGKEGGCEFLDQYAAGLRKLDFPVLYQKLESLCTALGEIEGREPEIILLLHEAPDNPCSERWPLQEWFKENGVEIKEWQKEEEM